MQGTITHCNEEKYGEMEREKNKERQIVATHKSNIRTVLHFMQQVSLPLMTILN